MNLRLFQTVKERREAVEQAENVSLKHIGTYSLDEEKASTKHCENMIGITQVPLGVAGPLTFSALQLQNVKRIEQKSYYVPIATTEGALVASVNRGCKAITDAGGAVSIVKRVGTTRSPVFETRSLQEAYEFSQWIENNKKELEGIMRQTSSHLSLLSVQTQVVGPLVFVRLAFDTQEAMGMNMVTIACQQLAGYVFENKQIPCISVSGNYCVDKKPSAINTILGRGMRAWCEVFLPTNIITGVLKTTPEVLKHAHEVKCFIGSALSGSLGFNGHAANMIAGIYLATGQDIAHTVEGSQCVTTILQEAEGLRFSVLLPSLLVGTVGGGTGLSTQQEAIKLLHLEDGGTHEGEQALEFAGIIAGTVLAGELSELAALASGTLTKAHEKLARGK